MIVKGTALDHARELRKRWERRLAAAEQRNVGTTHGLFPSQSSRDIEIATCKGALFVLNELVDASYSEHSGSFPLRTPIPCYSQATSKQSRRRQVTLTFVDRDTFRIRDESGSEVTVWRSGAGNCDSAVRTG